MGWKVREDGTRIPIRKVFRGRTAEEAINKRDEEKAKVRRGEISRAPEKQTVEQFMAAWLRAITLPIVRQKTFNYYSFCARHISEKLGRIAPKKLTSQQIQEFLAGKLGPQRQNVPSPEDHAEGGAQLGGRERSDREEPGQQ